MTDVSVLMPLLNEERNVEAAVEMLRAQTFEGTMEFLLLDGGSTDSTLARLAPLIEGDRRFRLLTAEDTNVPTRLNLGLSVARGRYVARMDTHGRFPPNYLADGIERLARGDVASVSGPQIAVGSGTWSRRIALAMRSGLGRGESRFRQLSAREHELESGYCGIWERSLLLAQGGWDELASGGEDTELAARVRRSGGRIICVPEMAAEYQPRESLQALARQYGGYAYRRAWIARRYPEVLRRSHALPPALLVASGCAVLGRRPAARLARRGLWLYAAALVVESVRVGSDASPRDTLALPAVYGTMHLAWGAGFVASCVRHGPPVGALFSRARRARL
jgi:glycosyltransferase involved in cell wall biosynthesis